MNISIIGIGGVGGILTALLSKKGYKTTAVSSANSVNDIKQNGLEVSSSFFGSFKSFPEAKEVIEEPFDIIFFATKYPFLNESVNRIRLEKIGNPVFVSLLNGLGSRELIINKVGSNFLTATIGSIEVYRDINGVIQQPLNQAPVINFAKEPNVKEQDLSKVIEVINSIGISTNIFNNYNEVIWNKLVRLGAIGSATAAFQKSIGEIRDDKEMREILIGLIKEGAIVANSYGVITNESKEIEQVDLLPHSLKTSLSRDVSAGKPSELESITKAIIRKAREQNLNTPNYEFTLKLIEKNYEL